MDKIWYRNPSKSEVIAVVAGMKKTNDHAELTKVGKYAYCLVIVVKYSLK